MNFRCALTIRWVGLLSVSIAFSACGVKLGLIGSELASSSKSSATNEATQAILAPTVAISSHPSDPSPSALASFSFSGSEPGGVIAGYQCQLDGGAIAACASPVNYSGLVDGAHLFSVWATDSAGSTSTAAIFAWTVSIPGKLAFTVAPSSVGVAGAALGTQPTVSIEDTLGNVVTSSGDAVTLAAYTASDCTGAALGTFSASTNPLTASSGVAAFSGVSYTKAETIYLQATSGALTSACSGAIAVSAGAPASITKIAGDTQTATVATLLPIDPEVQVTDAYGNAVSGANVTFTPSGSGASVGTSPVTTDSNGYASTSWTIGTVSGSGTNTLLAAIGSSPSVTFTVTASPGSPAKLAYSSGSSTPIANQCAGAYTIVVEDTYGNLSPVGPGFTVSLSGNGSGSFFTDSGCSSSAAGNQLSVANGQSSASYYFSDGALESLTHSASSSGMSAVTYAVGIHANLVFSGPASMTAGVCAAFTITAVDANNAPIAVPGGATISPSGGNSYYHAFYGSADTTCASSSVTGVGIASGGSSVVLNLIAAYATHASGLDYLVLTSSNSLINQKWASLPIILANSAAAIVTTGPSFVQQGACSGPFVVTAVDNYGNIASTGGATSVGISSDLSAGVYQDSSCTQGSPISIGAGTSTAQFYMKDSVIEEPTLTADASGSGLGTSTFKAQVQAAISGVQSVTTGGAYSCALINGGVQCWGMNNLGQLGNGTFTDSAAPVAVSGLTSGVIAISASNAGTTCAVLSNGNVMCWGWDYTGAYIHSSVSPTTCSGSGYSCYTTPVQVEGLPGGATDVSADGLCALVGDKMWCWANFQAPAEILNSDGSPFSGVTQMAAGYYGSRRCAVAGGKAYCWGANWGGAVGNGDPDTWPANPYQVQGLSGTVSQIASGEYSTCVLLTDGHVQCWGGGDGTLGNGGGGYSLTPVTATLSNAIALIAGNDHFCALISGGTVSCWGTNAVGQVGNGTLSGTQATPAPVSGLSGATLLSRDGTGANTTCAIINGNFQCWGQGQIWVRGDGALGDVGAPVPALSFN